MSKVYLQGVGVLGPGLANWSLSQAILTGLDVCEIQALQFAAVTSLPANERRRASRLSKMAIYVAEEAMVHSGMASMDQATVYASSCGDLDIVDKICRALTMEDKPVSPTQFHNSVHNAQAGYWAIANQAHQASNSISAFTGSFSAGLLEALVIATIENIPVLLVVYDRPASGALFLSAPSRYEFAMAIVLTPQSSERSLACLQIDLCETQHNNHQQSICHSSVLEELRLGCPAARALPFLESLARKESAEIVLPYLKHLDVVVTISNYD